MCQLDDLAGGCSGGLGSRAAFSLSRCRRWVGEESLPLTPLDLLVLTDVALQHMLSRYVGSLNKIVLNCF